MFRILFALMLMPTVIQTVIADDTTEIDLQPLIDASRDDFRVFVEQDLSAPLPPMTVMRWANNARGSANGATLVWTHQGRPEVVCCIYPWMGRLEHAFGSLSRGKVRVMKDGKIVWAPKESGVTFSEVPGAPAVAKSANLRKRQLTQLARQFSGTMTGWKKDNSDREELRLLNTPLYRYEPADSQLLDGALFAFAQGTDPEILLLLEAWSPDGQPARWHYAFVRRTSGGLAAHHKGVLVWEAEKHPDQHQPLSIHMTIPGAAIR
ncbi:MAG: hypothetical protein R3C59_12445 [Planctomycetaceae bacterium]